MTQVPLHVNVDNLCAHSLRTVDAGASVQAGRSIPMSNGGLCVVLAMDTIPDRPRAPNPWDQRRRKRQCRHQDGLLRTRSSAPAYVRVCFCASASARACSVFVRYLAQGAAGLKHGRARQVQHPPPSRDRLLTAPPTRQRSVRKCRQPSNGCALI
jgi:hypothetical protein